MSKPPRVHFQSGVRPSPDDGALLLCAHGTYIEADVTTDPLTVTCRNCRRMLKSRIRADDPELAADVISAAWAALDEASP